MRVSMDLPMASSSSDSPASSASTDQVVMVPLPVRSDGTTRFYPGHHHHHGHHDHRHGPHHHHHHGRHRGHHFHPERIIECLGNVQGVGEEIGAFEPRVAVNDVGGEDHHRGHLRARMIVNPFRVLSGHGDRLHRKVSKRKHHCNHGHRRFKHGMMMRALISSSESFEQAAGEGAGGCRLSTGGPAAAAFHHRHGFPSHLLTIAPALYEVEPAAATAVDPSSSSSSPRLLDIVEALHDIELGRGEGLSSGGDPLCPRRHGRHGRSHHHHHRRHRDHNHHQGHRGRWIFVHEEPALAATPVDVVGQDSPPVAVPVTEAPQAEEAGPSATYEEKVAEGDIMACED